MANIISYIMVLVGLAMLLMYGADVAAAGEDGDGFLPMNSMQRGLVLGAPPIPLAIAAFVISRKDLSMPLGGLIIAIGVLIIIGGIMAASPADSEGSGMGTSAGLAGVGAGIAVLGGIACVKSR